MEEHVEHVEEIGLIGRMVRVFHAPGETFEAVGRRHSWQDWVIPLLIVAVAAVISAQMTMPVILKMQQQAVETAGEDRNMTEEQRQQQREVMEKMAGLTGVMTMVSTPITMFIMALIFGAIYLLIGRLVLGGELAYTQMLCIHAYTSLITILQLIVLTPLRQAKDEMIVALGPGLLLSDEMLETFVGKMISLVDIFMLWEIAVAAVGLSVLAKAPFGKALTPLLVLWVLYLIGAAALSGLIPGTGM
jgi:hypothetical protein